jgi:hypothetical protein
MKRTPDGKFTSEGNIGRPKGSTSKQTKELRQRFKLLLDENLDALQSDLDQLKPKDRIDAILSLANYVVPKLKSSEMTVEDVSKNEFRPIEIIKRVIVDEDK